MVVGVCAGATFWLNTTLRIESQALELQARQRLEQLVDQRIAISGDAQLIEDVIRIYEDAVISDPGNADAWIGMSMAICQLHFRNPSAFMHTGARAVAAALRAYELYPEYWLASAQLGVSLALSGEHDAAGEALSRALDLAPNSSNAHYYYASFLSNAASTREQAVEHVERALEINPHNAAARRLQQKLLIL